MDDNKLESLKAGIGKDRVGANFLDEVRLDAKRNYILRLKEQEEKRQFEKLKQQGFDVAQSEIQREIDRLSGKVPATKKGN